MFDVTLDTADQHSAFRRALTDRDIRTALALLNDRVSYRFTAIYKLVGSVLRAQYAFDRTSEYRTWLMCARRPNFDHPCRLNADQGWKAAS
jgi:hypothetical protein